MPVAWNARPAPSHAALHSEPGGYSTGLSASPLWNHLPDVERGRRPDSDPGRPFELFFVQILFFSIRPIRIRRSHGIRETAI